MANEEHDRRRVRRPRPRRLCRLLVRVGDALRHPRQCLARRHTSAARGPRAAAAGFAGRLGARVPWRRRRLRPRLPRGARRGCDWILEIDAGFSHDPGEIGSLLSAMPGQRLRLRQPVPHGGRQPRNALATHRQPRRDAADESRPRHPPDRHDRRLRAVHARGARARPRQGNHGRAGRSSRPRSRCTAATSRSPRCRFTTTRRATASGGVRSARRCPTSGGLPGGASRAP